MKKLLMMLAAFMICALLVAACGEDKKDEAVKDADKALADADKNTDEALDEADEALKDAAAGAPTAVPLAAVKGSGISGVATLTEKDGKVTVAIALTDAEKGASRPAHIHEGTCAKPNPAPKYPLENVVNGTSNTTFDATFEDLKSGDFLVNVHKSDDDLETYVACGDISFVVDEALAQADKAVDDAGKQADDAMADANAAIEEAQG